MYHDKVLPMSDLVKKKRITATVIRRSGDKTVSVQVSRVVVHPLYGKRRTITKRYLVHDSNNECQVGDIVSIQQCRPYSARKRWKVVSK